MSAEEQLTFGRVPARARSTEGQAVVGRPSGWGVVFFLAQRGLRESPLSLVLLVGAIAAAVGFQVPNTANLQGYRQVLLDDGLVHGLGDVRIRPEPGSPDRFEEVEPLLARVQAVPGVFEAQGLLVFPAALTAAGRLVTMQVVGIDMQGRRRPYRFLEGRELDPADETGILLGAGLATQLGVGVGDRVRLRVLFSAAPALLDDGDLSTYDLRVRGLVTGTFGASNQLFVDRQWLALESGYEGSASLIAVHAHDHEQAEALVGPLEGVVPGAAVRSWMEDSPYLRNSVKASDAIGGASQVMMILGVGIPVLGLLYINTMRRWRQIGLLGAMGFSRRDIFTLFFLQALLVGCAGALLGSAVGYALCEYFAANPVFNWEKFVVRPLVTFDAFARPVLLVMLTTLLAGVYPALQAARLAPARSLRGYE
jgi:ABC-type lipoprotein release transport system permease subunit